jgi:hypothetical protein
MDTGTVLLILLTLNYRGININYAWFSKIYRYMENAKYSAVQRTKNYIKETS